MDLIIPLGGLSSRYGLSKPKWLLTHPDGEYMIEKAVNCLNPVTNFNKIILVLTEEVLKEFSIDLPTHLFARIFMHYEYAHKIEVVVLEGGSLSQLETVSRAIQHCYTSPTRILVKDCDNVFDLNAIKIKGQFVVSQKIHQNSEVQNLQQKSFIKCSSEYEIAEMVEKQVVSNEIAIGGYCFNNCMDIVKAYESMRKNRSILFMSNAINYLIKELHQDFHSFEANNYQDWGTIREWRAYCKQFINIFVDIDGVIFQNGSRAIEPLWGEQAALTQNVEKLLDLQRHGAKLIFSTARPKKYEKMTLRQLTDLGFEVDNLIMGLYHAKRLLINDFGGVTTPYPSAVALSVKRNTDELAQKIDDFFE